MKLISMTCFVLEQERPIPSADLHEADYYYKEYEVLQNICNYANFLKQPLKLEMFVPCDEYGNVLEEKLVENYENDFGLYSDFRRYNREYNEAKAKVLFEGFEYNGITLKCEKPYHSFTMGALKTIEELSSSKHELTPNAIKQLGL